MTKKDNDDNNSNTANNWKSLCPNFSEIFRFFIHYTSALLFAFVINVLHYSLF